MDTHPVINETSGSWASSATLEVRLVSLTHQESGRGTLDSCGQRNSTSTVDEVANVVKKIALNQDRNAEDISDQLNHVRRLLEEQVNDTRLEELTREMRAMKQLVAPTPIECATGEPTKQALFSALACEYNMHCYFTSGRVRSMGVARGRSFESSWKDLRKTSYLRSD